MKKEELDKKNLPDSSGVYIFKARGKILYIGRATSLCDRVSSYFNSVVFEARGPLIGQMVEKATDVDFTVTDSVLEAVILESELIKKHQPKYNTKEKSDKSFNCVVTTDEKWPVVKIVRERDLGSIDTRKVFGPFPHGTVLSEALKIIRKIFPFRDNKCKPAEEQKGKPKACFSKQISLCPGVCTGEISSKEYMKIIRKIELFFSGKKKILIKKLKKEMLAYSKKLEFEKANEVKKTIFALEHIQDIALIKKRDLSKRFRMEAYDVAHLAGQNPVGVMTVVSDGVVDKGSYRKFKIRSYKKEKNKDRRGISDTLALKEILSRRLDHPEWPTPDVMVVDGGKAQKNAALSVLKIFGLKIPVVAVVKDSKHKPSRILGNQKIVRRHYDDILLANNEAHLFAVRYHRSKRKIPRGKKRGLSK